MTAFLQLRVSLLTGFSGALLLHLGGCAAVRPTVLPEPPATVAAAADPIVQRTFATPAEAVSVLKAAAQADDRPALREIFGPESRELVSGDQIADANSRATFAKAIAQYCRLSYQGDDKVVLNLGAQDWPFPIPLVHEGGHWRFDTAAGKDEIVNRRVGENELMAIEVCRIYVAAQHEYAS
ncbi:MAG: DUF2950 family protein, partial [Verrucomicrobia bacterium]|nr:DUF2950 family protein [Verrucomicrobiota bacterium]